MKNKRITIILAAILALATTVSAKVKFGFEAGATINKMSFSKDVYDSDNCSGFFVGPKIKATVPVFGIGFDASVLYAQSKAQIGDAKKEHMSYVRVPVNVRWEIGPRMFGAYIATGPQWDWYIGDAKLYTSDGLRATFEHNTISWNIGLGLMLLNHVELGASYNLPITKTGSVKDIYNSLADDIEMKNNVWQVRLSVYF